MAQTFAKSSTTSEAAGELIAAAEAEAAEPGKPFGIGVSGGHCSQDQQVAEAALGVLA
ncbi:MAG: hypothetical protein QOC64_537 [Solirubrobacteraceae bacterium]|jgi:uncharacterized protein GlcG (DUF336 family)|nr:hypothetical protein [Solirubrobacteraceae bacterium]